MHALPYGERRDDPPKPDQNLSFRLGVWVRRSPILAALTIAFIVMTIPLTLILIQQKEIQHTQRKANLQRQESIKLICTQNDVLVTLLISNPMAAGKQKALARLNGQDCRQLLKEVGADDVEIAP